MLKDSLFITLIQLVGVILGFLSIYLVAGEMGPEVYSLVGIYGVVSGVVLTFSHLGVETTMMREALYWIENGDEEKVREYTTQSILSRFIGFVILLPFVAAYLLFLYVWKYNSIYGLILVSFYFGACANALIDSMSLIVRSKGDFVFSQFARTINNSVSKFIAIFLYLKFGSEIYLYFYCLIPVPLLFIFYFKLRGFFSLKYLDFKGTFKKIKESKNLWLKSYVDYFSANADSLLVSIIFPSSIMGIYTLYKNLESVAKVFIEGFFDVLTQKMVQFKGNLMRLAAMERKINIVRWTAILFIIVGACVFLSNPAYFVNLCNLAKYDSADLVISTIFIISVLYLIGKNEINLISLMGTSRLILFYGIAIAIVTLLSYVCIVFMPSVSGLMLQRVLIYFMTSAIAIYIFRKNRDQFYSSINK